MLQGKVTVDAVIEELLSQHPVVHEREKRGRDGKGGGSFDLRTVDFMQNMKKMVIGTGIHIPSH